MIETYVNPTARAAPRLGINRFYKASNLHINMTIPIDMQNFYCTWRYSDVSSFYNSGRRTLWLCTEDHKGV